MINLSVMCLNILFKVINLFVELLYLFVLFPFQCLTVSLYQPDVTPVPCVSPIRIPNAIFSSHMPNICCTNAWIQSFLSKLKTTSTLKSSLSSHQIYAPTCAFKSPYSADWESVRFPLVATFSTSSHKTSDRATPVSRPILSSSTMDRYVNYLNSSDKGKTKPLSFQTTKSLFPKSLVPFKTSVCIKPSASGTISNGAVSDSINTSQLFCTCAVFYF